MLINMQVLVVAFCIVASICTINSARILGVFHIPAYSHYQLGDKILKTLAAKGHEITVITPYAEKTPIKNFKQIVLTRPAEQVEEKKTIWFELPDMGFLTKIVWLDLVGLILTESTLNHTNVQELMKSGAKFDMIVLEQTLNEAFKGFCYYFDASCVVFSTIGATRWTNPQMGNPGPPSYVPDLFLSLSSYMDFWERLYNSIVYSTAELVFNFYTFPKQNDLLHKYFPGAPHLNDLQKNVSLMLLNSHVSTNSPVPFVPTMIDIGGFHVNPPKKLPKDIQDYLDSAKDGAIFFSMGSNLKSKNLPTEKRDAILKVFSKLKQKILWKWEDETLPGQPPNVKLGKWLPQQDILAHPNIKLFITHGGLLSTIETIYHGVPIVGIPVFIDQEMNVANAEIAGYGIAVPFKTLTEETLGAALNEILNNPKYMENAKRRSNILHDQPMKPLDKAIFWLEYVLRHQGVYHLQTQALNLLWYQYLLLDVVAVIGVVLLISFFVFCAIVKRLVRQKQVKEISHWKKKHQ